MPTILKWRAFRIIINIKDHGPAHVHVVGSDCQVLIEIESLATRNVIGFKPREIQILKDLVAMEREFLMTKWRQYHGKK
jgi:hypothetical protein